MIVTDRTADLSETDRLHALGERIWLAAEMASDPIWDLHENRLGVQPPLQIVGGILATTRDAFDPRAQAEALQIAAALGDDTLARLAERLLQGRRARAVLRAPRSAFLRSLITMATAQPEAFPPRT